jgi:DNA-binding transcriptional ArsR family regulator
VDEVFKAVADAGRRALLDALRERDGQTVGELCETLPDMTRFGVMKHLRILEDAHLVVTERAGRSKHHYLNPVPIREIHDRWIAPYREPMVVGLLALRDRAEGA